MPKPLLSQSQGRCRLCLVAATLALLAVLSLVGPGEILAVPRWFHGGDSGGAGVSYGGGERQRPLIKGIRSPVGAWRGNTKNGVGEIPCNLLGRSSFRFQERPTSVQVKAKFNGGRTGNLLFTLGANIVHALDQNATPLLPPTYDYLPVIFNSSMNQSDVSLEAPSLGAPFYQHHHYSIKFHQYRDELCYYMAMEPFEFDLTPGDRDVVIYVRDITNEPTLGAWQGTRRLYAPPPRVFYDRILQKNDYEKVWIVGDPEIMNSRHPIVGYLMDRYNATNPRNTDPLKDLQFISLARNIIMSPSTFCWWAAYFSSYRTTLHFPIMPAELFLPWCELLFYGRPMVRYYDWFRHEEFDDVDQAREVCIGYLEGTSGDITDESILSFY